MVIAAAGGLGAVSHSLVSTAKSTETSRVSQQSLSYLKPRLLLTTLPGVYPELNAGSPSVEEVPAIAPETLTSQVALASAPVPTPVPTPQPKPAYFTYVVKSGDSVEGIASAFGVESLYLLWNNPELRADPNYLVVGQQLVIPSVGGLIYTVKLGDTLSDIADFYEIEVGGVVDFAPNGLSSANNIKEGMVLVLPGAVPPPPPPPRSAPSAPRQPPVGGAALASTSGLIWPFVGSLSSYFGEPRGNGFYHDAIDIDAYGRCGAPVMATAAGTVVLAGWDSGGLGNRIVIRHGNGMDTLYAHLTEVYVGTGQVVAQGGIIGTIGSTGYSTGCHLHFAIYVGGVGVDPLNHLP